MHIAIPFDIETVKQSWGQPGRMWGRVMGNHTFLRALADTKGCTRLSLFVPSRHDVDVVGKTLMAEFGANRAKVTVVPFAQLQAYLAARPVDVMHMLDPNMWLAAHIRSRLSGPSFPVTGVTHSLGNQHFLEWALLNNANGVNTDDCLVCSTPTALSVVQSVFARLGASQPEFVVPSTTVIPFGISLADFAGSPGDARAQIGIPADTFVVTSLARFNYQFKMDLRPVLRLASLLKRQISRPLKFILAGSSGDGQYVGFLREQIKAEGLENVVELVTDPDEPRKVSLLRGSDVFLSLSDNIQETFGLTPIEAMAAGLPVVASDRDGYRSLIEEGVSGFLVPTRGPAPAAGWEAALALRYDSLVHLFSAQTTAVDLDVACEHLARLATDTALRDRMAAAARQRAGGFDWKLVIGQYLKLWERMRAERKSPGAGMPVRSSAMRFTEDFVSYATATLKPEDRFRTTHAGKVLRTGKKSIQFYFETDEFLVPGLMSGILERCEEGCSVAQLSAALISVAPGAAAQVGHNILWLYKYGYLRTDKAQPSPE
jgi:glycosyltransferase involved in cell wall biosynthesis